MPTPVTEPNEGGQHMEWSETFHAFVFRARIYLKRYWWIIIFTVLGGVLAQAWSQRNAQPVYVSTAEMMVNGMISGGSSTTAEYNENLANFFQTQIHLMQDPDLQKEARENAMAKDPVFLPPHPPESVNGSPELLSNSLILRLTAYGSDPTFTKDYLESWMQTFLDHRKTMREQKIVDYDDTMMSVANKNKDDVDRLEQDKEEFLAKNNVTSIDGDLAAAAAKRGAISNQLDELQAQWRLVNPDDQLKYADLNLPLDKLPPLTPLAETDRFKEYLDGKNVEEIDRELVGNGLLGMNADYQANKDELLNLNVQYQELSQNLRDDPGHEHPKILRMKGAIQSLVDSLAIQRKQRVEALEERRSELISTIAYLKEDEKTWSLKVADFEKLKSEYDGIDYKFKMKDDMYQKLLQQSTNLEENKELGQELLTINKHATAAAEIPTNPMKQIGQGAFVGLVAGAVIIFLLGALDGRVLSVEDITQRFDEPVLGVIPMQKRVAGQVALLKNNDDRQMFAESCRNIRSSLLYMDRQGQRPRIIMLTSSMPSEGKSTLSANLAITLGFAASRTLLVDADMRRGQLHKRFNLKNDSGLAEHIRDGVPLDSVIQHTGMENLDFIPCGQYPEQPGELLMSERFNESIQTLKQRYDFVIFDSPPILLTDDAASFATRTDAVLFVVRAGYTRLRQVRTSLESLHRRGVNVYGMVINFIDHREPGYYSYRYYDYYSYRPNRSA